MNAPRTPVRRIAMGLAVAAALATSACAAGQVAGTAEQKTTLDGTNVDIGNIALRGLAIETPDSATFPSGSNLELKVVIVNNSTGTDTLTRISSTSTTSWGGFADEDSLIAGAVTPELATAARVGIPIGRGLAVSYGVPAARNKVLALTGTKQTLYPGATLRITFTFAKAGSKTFTVPIQLSDDGSYTPTPKVLPSEGSSEG